MIVTCRRLLKNTKINAITLYPFILLQKKDLKENKVLINHEKIHIRQQIELLVVFFYILYVSEYFIRWVQLQNRQKAYRAISFEREAYDHEDNMEYLSQRKYWSFTKYWKKC